MRKSESKAGRTMGSSITGREWRVRRRLNVSWVKLERVGLLGPNVERTSVTVWRKRRRRCGVRNGLYVEFFVDLDLLIT